MMDVVSINQNLEIRYACVRAAKTFPNFGLSFFCFVFFFFGKFGSTLLKYDSYR